MANEQNLIPQNRRAKSEQREIARKGGQASGEKRRERKALKDDLLYLLEQNIVDKQGREHATQRAIAAALIQQALRGNVRAFEIIRDTIGEKPTETVAIAAPDYSALDAAFEKLAEKRAGMGA